MTFTYRWPWELTRAEYFKSANRGSVPAKLCTGTTKGDLLALINRIRDFVTWEHTHLKIPSVAKLIADNNLKLASSESGTLDSGFITRSDGNPQEIRVRWRSRKHTQEHPNCDQSNPTYCRYFYNIGCGRFLGYAEDDINCFLHQQIRKDSPRKDAYDVVLQMEGNKRSGSFHARAFR